ncbi:MAG: inositol-3-phosphate synthase [Bacillota bacterium]|nr:inositol-3-phosphate synthase [Bacillota bacterium]
MPEIKIAIVGVGNCASALIQGIHYYGSKTEEEAVGLMHWEIGGYRPFDIEVAAAFDIDRRKVGYDLSEAIFAPPNCTTLFYPHIPPAGVKVQMGRILDGFSEHMGEYEDEYTFLPARQAEPTREEVVETLRRSGSEVMLNYLPVGSEEATRFYAGCALEAGVAFINNIPVFIASDRQWAEKFAAAKLPLIGDDIKSQLGATIIHRTLAELFGRRGVKLDRSYQLNTGGNTDFLNMTNKERVITKRLSKTEAVQSAAARRLADRDIHIGPSDYVPWQKDNKVCFLRMEGEIFGNVPINLEMRLSVEDSPNSAGIAIDAIRCCQLAFDRGIGGLLEGPSAFFSKHPPRQYSDHIAYLMTEDFINGVSHDE